MFLTHSHLDHTAALPLLVDSVGSLRRSPITVHALAVPPRSPHAMAAARDAAPSPPPTRRALASMTGRHAPTERMAETSASVAPSAVMASLSTIHGMPSAQPSSRTPCTWLPVPVMAIALPRMTVP